MLTMVTSSSAMKPTEQRDSEDAPPAGVAGLLGHRLSISCRPNPGVRGATRVHHGDMPSAVDIRVTGRVQGVSFRFHAEQEAQRLGLTGWVRNEPDGSVALHVEGEPDAIEDLVSWCHDGPSYARVDGVEVSHGERDRRHVLPPALLSLVRGDLPRAAPGSTLSG